MAEPQEKLAASLEVLRGLQEGGKTVLRATDLSRTHRQRLLKQGFIAPVINGWYIPSRPDAPVGETTAWYASYWDFVREYLNDRFGDEWSLSPEASLLIHAGQWRAPDQLLVRSPRAGGRVLALPHATGLYDLRLAGARDADLAVVEGVRTYAPEAALVAAGPGVWSTYPTELRTVLASLADIDRLLERLLSGGHTVIAGRIAGALRNIGRDRQAADIIGAMKTAGYDAVRETDPFEARLPGYVYRRDPSPYVQRIRLLWRTMRDDVLAVFPRAPDTPVAVDAYLDEIDGVYATDAYHSLSIEGYRVDADLIERVKGGDWNPEGGEADRRQGDALAARGYFDAFQSVKESVRRVVLGENAGRVADEDHRSWYRGLFGPCVQAGLIPPGALAGYRNGPVYIRGSRHAPLNPNAVRDAMAVLFELLAEEPEPAVRVVLGHFMFVYIHPYLDGNGRMGRFLMNLMFASGGWSWTVVPVERRTAYMAALESASVGEDIRPFARLLSEIAGQAAPPAR